MAEIESRRVTIAKQRFDLRRETVERAMRQMLPEPISSHYVVIGPRRYPPKQVIAVVTGMDRADFTTHQARRILRGLGFAVGRVPLARGAAAGAADDRVATTTAKAELVRTLSELRGQWVAIKADELLVAASTPQDVVAWLARHDRRADSMFRVPEDEIAAAGLAPL